MAIARSKIHTKDGLRRFLISAINQRKHVQLVDENLNGSIVIITDVPISNLKRTFQIDIRFMDEK